MLSRQHKFVALSLLSLASACSNSAAPNRQSADFYGRWEKVGSGLPPVALSVRLEGTATVGQVWLSGVTYTLPAVVDDTSVVLTDPASSKLAPFVGVIRSNGVMRATLRGEPDVVVDLQKVQMSSATERRPE